MHDFQGYFSRTFQDQSDLPGLSRSWNFQEKIQDFPGGVGTLCNTRWLRLDFYSTAIPLHFDRATNIQRPTLRYDRTTI